MLRVKFSKYLIPFLICLIATSALAQDYSTFQFLKEKKKKQSIPFKFVHNLIIIPVFINDSDTLHLVLDTGVQTTLLTEMPSKDSISLNFVQKLQVNGLGGGEPIDVYYSSGNKISLPGIEGYNQDIYFLEEDKLVLSPLIGMEVNGLIGYDLLKNFIVEINYLTQIITFHKRDHFDYKFHKKSERIPFSLARSKPYINIKVRQPDGNYLDAKVLIDLGASYSCSLYEFTNKAIVKPDKTVKAHLGKGLSGDIKGELGRIDYLTIGGFELEEPIIAYPEEKSVKAAVDLVEHQGSIGSGILSRFHVLIDYKENYIYLTPNKNFRKKFVYNLSGINIITPVPDLPLYVVESVDLDSPADVAGIREGDVLVKINDKSVSKYSLSEILNQLNTYSGDKLNLVLSRDSKLYKTKIVLKDQL